MRRSSVVLPAPEPPTMHVVWFLPAHHVDPAEDLGVAEAFLHVLEDDDVVGGHRAAV